MEQIAIADVQNGLFVPDLTPGTVIKIETRNRPYRIECISGNEVRISGHPTVCPIPLEMKLEGSIWGRDHFEPGFIGKGMRLVFGRPEEGLSVTTSEILSVEVNAN